MPVRRGLCWRLVATAIGALLGVQFPLPWSGLLGAATAAAIANLLAGEAIGPRRWLQLAVQVALGCLIGTSLVPALANPVLLPAALARRLGLTQESGLLVLATEPQGPADRAGLLIGDIVVGLAGQPVRSTDDLLALLGPERVGTVQEVRVVRGGELHRLTVTIGERP